MKYLSQVVANEKTVKNAVYGELTKLYHELQKPDLTAGLQKTYQPHEEDGEKFPPDSKNVQLRVEARLTAIGRRLTQLFEVTAQRDYTNTVAKADVIVNGAVILADAPVPYLLFLEKQLKDFKALVLKLPLLDPTKKWEYDPQERISVADPIVTARSKKVPKPVVLFPATDKHPAQTQLLQEDVLVGNWTTVHQSGAISTSRRDDVLERLETLTAAVKSAREEANRTQVVPLPNYQGVIIDYLLNG